MAIRQPGEPASRPNFYAALNAAQNVGPASGDILYLVIAANKGGSAANLLIADGTGNIASIQVPAGDTRSFDAGECGVRYSGQLAVTPSAAMDVTVVVQ